MLSVFRSAAGISQQSYFARAKVKNSNKLPFRQRSSSSVTILGVVADRSRHEKRRPDRAKNATAPASLNNVGLGR